MHEFITIPEEEELSRLLRMEEEVALRAAGKLTDEEQRMAIAWTYGWEEGEDLPEPDPFEDDHQALNYEEYGPCWYRPWEEEAERLFRLEEGDF